MKIAVSSYSFHRLTDNGTYTEEELIPLAKKMGFDAIEFAEIHPKTGECKAACASRLRERSEKEGLPIVNYAIGADFLYGSDGDLEKEIARLCEEVDIAALLGCRLMRHDVAYGWHKEEPGQKGFSQALPRLIEGCRGVTAYAREKSIRTMTENHGKFCQDADRVERLVSGVGDDNYGVLLDMGNFLCADDSPTRAFGILAPYCFHVHAKDFHVKSAEGLPPRDGFFATRGGHFLRGAIIGHGEVPVLSCLKIMRDAGFDGYVTVEFEGIEDPELGVAYGRNTLLQMAEFLDM